MRFSSFAFGGFHLYGRVVGDAVELPSARFAAEFPTLKAAIAANALARFEPDPDAAALPLEGLSFDPVIPDPGKILCAGRNYRDHGDEEGRPDNPPVFIRLADTLIGHGAPLVIPAECAEFELEGELAVIVGKPGRAIALSNALDHVAGYCCFNDASARDWQHHSPQYTAGKNFPGTGACGPWLVTPDEVGDPGHLLVEARVDGELHQSASTEDMLFSVAELIAYISRFTPLSPGDIIPTGTPVRVGAGKTDAGHLKPGSLVEIEIESVGRLANRTVRAPA